YINGLIDSCRPLLKTVDWNSVKTIGNNICRICNIFTGDKKTLKRIIALIKDYHSAYGYFMNYYFLNAADERGFCVFRNIYIEKCRPERRYRYTRTAADDRRYLPDDGFTGLIPRLYKLNYTDLLSEVFTDLIIPVFERFSEYESNQPTPLMQKLGLVYENYNHQELFEGYILRNVLKKYVNANKIPVPDQLNKYFACFNLTEDTAKEYFFSFKCCTRDTFRGDIENAEKFKSFNLPDETLDLWTNEWLSGQLNTSSYDAGLYRHVVFKLNDRVNAGNAKKLICRYDESCKDLDDGGKYSLLLYVDSGRYSYDEFTEEENYKGLISIAAKNNLTECLEFLETRLNKLILKKCRGGKDYEVKILNEIYSSCGINRQNILSFRQLFTENCGVSFNIITDNAKEIYFALSCNYYYNDTEIDSFITDNFTKEQAILWNDEYINALIDKSLPLLQKDDWKTISQTGENIRTICKIYTDSKETYQRILDFLKAFYSAYGYFVNYNLLPKEQNNETFPYWCRYLYLEKSYTEVKTTGTELNYLEDDNYYGLIPRLCKLNYNELLTSLLNEVIVPIFEHYKEQQGNIITPVMAKNNIVYSDLRRYSGEDADDWYFKKEVAKYLKNRGVNLTGKIKKYM
ncbi:MAG: hypothetical protein LUD27_00365, partial [Clostridia bacterium]|nr:hypothetical protein [Clostridia bacterium]